MSSHDTPTSSDLTCTQARTLLSAHLDDELSSTDAVAVSTTSRQLQGDVPPNINDLNRQVP